MRFYNTHDCDAVAAELVKHDSERAFTLFEQLLAQEPRSGGWDIRESHGDHRLFGALRDVDSERTLRLILTHVSASSVGSSVVAWWSYERIDLATDADVLFSIAKESEEQALAVAAVLSHSQAGFWELTVKIADAYPNSDAVHNALSGAFFHTGIAITGPGSEYLRRCAEEAAARKQHADTPAGALVWLSKVEESFRAAQPHERRREQDDDIELDG